MPLSRTCANSFPTRKQAEKLLQEAEYCNPGPWANHSRVAGYCAERIASCCDGLNPEKSYVLGLLHDIGRKFGTRHLGHVSDGYSYMLSLGYKEVARVCLTHSFTDGTINSYVGRFDTTTDELDLIQNAIESIVFDEYDKLIQLCDAIAGSEGVLEIEHRMNDVRKRYGYYPQEKWNANISLMKYFEERTGKDIYALVEKYS